MEDGTVIAIQGRTCDAAGRCGIKALPGPIKARSSGELPLTVMHALRETDTFDSCWDPR